MVAGGENVNTQFEEFLGERRGDAETGGGVLSVGQHEVDGVLLHQSGKALFDDGSSRSAENVADKKNAHCY